MVVSVQQWHGKHYSQFISVRLDAQHPLLRRMKYCTQRACTCTNFQRHKSQCTGGICTELWTPFILFARPLAVPPWSVVTPSILGRFRAVLYFLRVCYFLVESIPFFWEALGKLSALIFNGEMSPSINKSFPNSLVQMNCEEAVRFFPWKEYEIETLSWFAWALRVHICLQKQYMQSWGTSLCMFLAKLYLWVVWFCSFFNR